MPPKPQGRVHGDRILVRRDEPEVQSAGGIILPEQAQKKPVWSTVIMIGSDCVDEQGAPLLAEGDRILHSTYGGVEVEIEGQDYVVLKPNDVLYIEA